MVYSHSSIMSFLTCQRNFRRKYIEHIEEPSTDAMRFGSLVHLVLDDPSKIPIEESLQSLKALFNINSWREYFLNIFEEVESLFEDYHLVASELKLEHGKLRGIIDRVYLHKETGRVLLIDFKTAERPRTYEELFIDQQLYIYGYLYCAVYGEDINNIDIGIVSIPKTDIKKPRLLKDGTLSKNKNQKTTVFLYKQTIQENGLNEEDYDEVLNAIGGNRYIHFISTPINIERFVIIIKDIEQIIKAMDFAITNDVFLAKHSYLHKSCGCMKGGF